MEKPRHGLSPTKKDLRMVVGDKKGQLKNNYAAKADK